MFKKLFSKKENKPEEPRVYKGYTFPVDSEPKNAEEAIDLLLQPFTKDQIKALEIDANNITVTFREWLILNTESKHPLLTNEGYLLEAKANIARFGYMFEQKEHLDLEALRNVFFGRFIRLFD